MTDNENSQIQAISGRGIAIRGDDIDTDRIIPARFLRCVTFDGLEEHAFEDDRRDLNGQVTGDHPFDKEQFHGANILVANNNFGCGSSREHAPQALVRWGIQAFIAESFAEIFFGNCVALGTPCVVVSSEDSEKLQDYIENNPQGELSIDLESKKITTSDFEVSLIIPDGPREAFLKGTWDATGLLMSGADQVDEVAKTLPYVSGF